MRNSLTALLCAALALASCGKSEDQIRAEERADMLEQQLADARSSDSDNAGDRDNIAAPDDGKSAAARPAESAHRSEPVIERPPSRTSAGVSLIGSYQAYIGDEDLYNSNGTRLTQPWAILRQDRVNNHVYDLADPDDTSDDFFMSRANREAMERMIANGEMTGDARRLITSGGAIVNVDIYGRGERAEYLDITVY